MKTALLLASLMIAVPAMAQTVTPAAAPAAAAAKYTLDTPLETIAADPAGKAALESAMPNITSHPSWDMFKAMSLSQLQPMSSGQITDEAMAKAKAALATVK